MKKKIVLSSIATLGVLSLVGCGGGGTPAKTNIATTSASTKISGVAVDDLILNGIVTAKTPSGTVLAEGRTSKTDGSYALNIAHTGIVLVNVTCEDGNSTMLNPVTHAKKACGSDVALNSLADVKAGVDQTVYISPLTEIVYQRAAAQAGDDISSVTATEFKDARAQVGVLFGVDPIADNPVDGISAQIIDAIHTLADKDSTTSVMDVTSHLADQLSDGTADEADTAVHGLTAVMVDENITNNLTDNNGTYTPPENPAALSDVDAAKALFKELRTQAMSVVDYDNSGTPGFLDTETQAMDSALNNITMNIGYMGDAINAIAEEIGNAYKQNLSHISANPTGTNRVFTVDKTGAGAWSYTIVEGSTTWSGTISFPDVLLGDTAEAQLYTAGTLAMTVNGTVPLDYTAETKAGVTDSQKFEGTVTVTKKTTGADVSLAGKIASNGTSIELKEATAELAYTEGKADADGNTEPVFNYFKLNKVVLQGIVGGYTVDGSVTVNSYVQNSGLAAKGGLYEVANSEFGVQFDCTDGSQVDISDVTFSYDGSTYQPSGYSDNDFWFYNINGDVQHDDILSNLDYTGSCTSGVSPSVYVTDTWSDSYENIANSGWLPNDITFAGAISRTGASVEGTLHAKWLNAATIDMDNNHALPLVNITLNGKLQIPERPEMLTTLTFENNATNNTIGASYTYDTTVINISALFDTDMNNGTVEVTTHTGLKADLNITNGNLVTNGTGTVTKDGVLVGTLEERSDVPVIKYIDGSFESLP